MIKCAMRMAKGEGCDMGHGEGEVMSIQELKGDEESP